MGLLLIDTNFFLDCARLGIPLDEVEKFGKILVPSNVLAEMRNLNLKGREEGFKRIAEQWILRYGIFPLEGRVDESLLELARHERITVATNDSRLKKSLKRLGAYVIFIRSRNHLELI